MNVTPPLSYELRFAFDMMIFPLRKSTREAEPFANLIDKTWEKD